MNAIAFIIILLIIIAIIVVVIYYVQDYLNYKNTINADLSTTQSAINSEKSDRVANLKYIVDQVNAVNSQIYTTTNQNIQNQALIEAQLDASQSNIISGLNSAFTFTDNNNNVIPITNLPGSPQPNLTLLNNVTAAMNLTAKNMNINGSVQMCSPTDPTKCSQFPDQNGNVYLTDAGNGSIILDGDNGTTINNNMNLYGSLNINSKSGSPSALINPSVNSLNIQTNKLGVGDFTNLQPQATLHINTLSNVNQNGFYLTTNNGQNLLTVDNEGKIRIYDNGANIATIEPIDPRDDLPGIKITATNVLIDGNLDVGGTITGTCVPPTPQLKALLSGSSGTGSCPPIPPACTALLNGGSTTTPSAVLSVATPSITPSAATSLITPSSSTPSITSSITPSSSTSSITPSSSTPSTNGLGLFPSFDPSTVINSIAQSPTQQAQPIQQAQQTQQAQPIQQAQQQMQQQMQPMQQMQYQQPMQSYQMPYVIPQQQQVYQMQPQQAGGQCANRKH